MKRSTRNTIIIGVLLLLVMFLIGCGKEPTPMIRVVANCTVSQVNEETHINCPDGTSVIIPPQVVTQTSLQTVEVPIYIEVPAKKCKKHGDD